MGSKLLRSLIITACVASTLIAQTSSGPKKGTLILTGGEIGKGVIERFVTLAGGPNANFIYIPTASSGIKLTSGFIYIPPDTDAPAASTREFEQELCKMFGIKRITVSHTRSRDTANSESFIEPLRSAQPHRTDGF